jgi:hypothetical protein
MNRLLFYILSLVLLWRINFDGKYIYGQTLKGKVVDSQTNEPLAYVNIGILGKNIGTVSDVSGLFSLTLPNIAKEDTLRVSMLGYEPIVFSMDYIQKILAQPKQDWVIQLKPKDIELKPIVVKPKSLKYAILGNRTASRNIIAGFTSNALGSELGTVMRIKKSPTYIESVHFNIAENLIGKIKFRINVYILEKGIPQTPLLSAPIYVETDIKSGVVSVNLQDYNLETASDFLVSLEWIEDYGTQNLYFSAGLLNKASFARNASQSYWQKIPVGIGFYAKVSYSP